MIETRGVFTDGEVGIFPIGTLRVHTQGVEVV